MASVTIAHLNTSLKAESSLVSVGGLSLGTVGCKMEQFPEYSDDDCCHAHWTLHHIMQGPEFVKVGNNKSCVEAESKKFCLVVKCNQLITLHIAACCLLCPGGAAQAAGQSLVH